MSPAKLLAAAFLDAHNRNPSLMSDWIKVSFGVGGKLPASMLSSSVQRLGKLDILLRAIEDDCKPSENEDSDLVGLMAFDWQSMLSEFWIGSAYEIVRLLAERKLAPEGNEFAALHSDLRHVRVALEKHELAGERKKGFPDVVLMARRPEIGSERKDYSYIRASADRAHIMARGLSARGSAMWQVSDVVAQTTYWVERRELAERILKLWGKKGRAL